MDFTWADPGKCPLEQIGAHPYTVGATGLADIFTRTLIIPCPICHAPPGSSCQRGLVRDVR